MGVVLGINSGFVETAPTTDPEGANHNADAFAWAMKDVAPSGFTTVTEMGWYRTNSGSAADFEVGIYDHNIGDDEPEALLSGSGGPESFGTTAGWKVIVGLNISISEGTTYYVTAQMDENAGSVNYNLDAGEAVDFKTSQTTLIDPWGTSTGSLGRITAIYALVAAPTGTNMQLQIGDAWKTVDGMQINIGDSWKAVAGAQINIGDAWKTIF